jgi:hypothetical protein
MPIEHDLGPVPMLEPQATPVDTFIRPPASSLEDVANSLQGFSADLDALMQKRQAQQAATDAVRGEAAFYQNNEQGYADAVASGKIPAQASPAFARAYKVAQGELAATTLADSHHFSFRSFLMRTRGRPRVHSGGMFSSATRSIVPSVLSLNCWVAALFLRA